MSAVLRIWCPDRKGLVARVSTLLYEHGANIVHADQHQDHERGLFFMRVEWTLGHFDLAAFETAFRPVATELAMQWSLDQSAKPAAVAVFVSQHLHCLADLLYRQKAGELACSIPVVVSNHPDARSLATFYGVEFEQTDDEAYQLEILAHYKVDLIVLARYMRILSPAFVARYPGRIINVHHSFLPAFVGGRPYHQAFERGVKLIGATSHYVTEVLDDGPIIEQDVIRISHRDQVADLVEKGRDLERMVLSRAVKWHLEHRILRYGDKTVIFD